MYHNDFGLPVARAPETHRDDNTCKRLFAAAVDDGGRKTRVKERKRVHDSESYKTIIFLLNYIANREYGERRLDQTRELDDCGTLQRYSCAMVQ